AGRVIGVLTRGTVRRPPQRHRTSVLIDPDLAVIDRDGAVFEILRDTAGHLVLVPGRQTERAVLESLVFPRVEDLPVADRDGAQIRVPIDVAAVEHTELRGSVGRRPLLAGRLAPPGAV